LLRPKPLIVAGCTADSTSVRCYCSCLDASLSYSNWSSDRPMVKPTRPSVHSVPLIPASWPSLSWNHPAQLEYTLVSFIS
jgi:hypothetical protein